MILPDKSINTFVGSLYEESFKNNSFEVAIIYESIDNKKYETHNSINLEPYRKILFTNEKNLNHIVEALKEINKTLKNLKKE